MKHLSLLFFLMIHATAFCASEISTTDAASLNEQIASEWDRVVSQANSKSQEIDALLEKDPSNEGLLSEKANYSIPGLLIKQLAIQDALLSKPGSTVSPNVTGDASTSIQRDQLVVVQATRLFFINKLKIFLAENPSYGAKKGDLIPKDYLQKLVATQK